jgi:Methyltransferase domain
MNLHREIYRAEQFPVFQNRMFNSEAEAKNCAKGDILLVQSLETGLIFNQAFKPELMQYGTDYQNEQALSSAYRQHLEQISEIIQKNFDGCSLIEVGCGKGYFLEQLAQMGFKITGFDRAYEGENPSIIKEYFTPEVGIHADGLILRHVLEHVQNPIEFIAKLCEANGGSGKIYIEAPCFDWIRSHHAWFNIFYEHVSYFRLDDFYRMFDVVYDAGHTFGGQYLYVVADLATIKTPVFKESEPVELPENFFGMVDTYAAKLKNGKASAIWGGASKGLIFALFMERAGVKIDTIIDINPAKQGKYLAGTGLQVYAPEMGLKDLPLGADIFVMNSNYLPEIVDLTENKFNYLTVDIL